jgi:hypothetical protein
MALADTSPLYIEIDLRLPLALGFESIKRIYRMTISQSR